MIVDSTEYIRASLEEVVHTFVEALLLVMLIVFLFLQSWRATLIPMLALGLSAKGAREAPSARSLGLCCASRLHRPSSRRRFRRGGVMGHRPAPVTRALRYRLASNALTRNSVPPSPAAAS